jgi:hypothetical protein
MIIGKTDKIQRERKTLDNYNKVLERNTLDVFCKGEVGTRPIKNRLGKDFIPQYKFIMDQSDIQYDDDIRILEFGGQVLDSGTEESNIPTDGLIFSANCETAYDGQGKPLLIDSTGNFTTNTSVSDFTFNESLKKFGSSAADFIPSQRYNSNENMTITGNQPRTVAFWIYNRSVGNNEPAFEWGVNGTNTLFLYYIRSTGGNLWTIFTGTQIISTGYAPVLDKWEHHRVSYTGTALQVFINNIKIGPDIVVNLNTVSTPLSVGSNNSPSIYMNGLIDQKYIYNRELTTEEGTAIYKETDPVGKKSNLLPIQLINRCSTPFGNIQEVYI